MPSDARPIAAQAAVEALQALSLARLAARSPTIVLGGAVLVMFVGAGLIQKLGLISSDPRELAAWAGLLALLVAFGSARTRASELEGPFGFLLLQLRLRALTGLRRAGVAVGASLALFVALALIARPDAAAAWSLAAAVGATGGGVIGLAGAVLLPPMPRSPFGRAGGGVPKRAIAVGLRVGLWLFLIVAALRTASQGDLTAQAFAVLAMGVAVLPELAIDPRTLNLLAVTPRSMARLILPLALRPAIACLVSAPVSGLVAGLGAWSVLGLAVILALIAGAARIFLGLAALGRSESAARAAGGIELVIVGLMPTAGPAAIGPLAGLWVLGRFAWLWRRGRRARWLDAEGAR